jgi:class 3 adenylate cyclase
MGEISSLFTDIVGSTERAVALGDDAWADLLERHHAAVRAEIVRFGGDEMDTSGDGFFVVFPEPSAAVEAGAAILDALEALELSVRIGIHAGDCRVADGKCTGLAIHIGARIVALASPGEVLVSDAVRTSVGAAYRFAERGTHELRGIPGGWNLSALERHAPIEIETPNLRAAQPGSSNDPRRCTVVGRGALSTGSDDLPEGRRRVDDSGVVSLP